MEKLNLDSWYSKGIISLTIGFILLFITWTFTNSQYTFAFEDAFFSKVYLWKFKVFSAKPKIAPKFIFINTSKDIALVDDTLDYGNIAISNREKLYQFILFINQSPNKPIYTLLDLQFYYKNTTNPSIDTLFNNEISFNKNIVIPILKNENGQYIKPFINANTANADYTSFGSGVTKFKLFAEDNTPTIPVFLHQKINRAFYDEHTFFSTCNKHLCLSSIWPSYYLNPNDLKNNKCTYAEYYNLGELLLGFEGDTTMCQQLFQNKIIIIGNFDSDIHITPFGKSSGSIILANVYLSLLNNQHLVSYFWLFILWIILSSLSYFACFSKLPKINLKFSFIFSKHLESFIQNYFTYMGYLLLFSLIGIFLFNLQIDLFLPAFLLTFLEYFSHKKYKTE